MHLSYFAGEGGERQFSKQIKYVINANVTSFLVKNFPLFSTLRLNKSKFYLNNVNIS